MNGVFSVFRRYFRRSSESGQSVILLAMGFIALAGFVGITTDISLMFVRYAQLSRAVDSAAVAAANQMRQDRSNATVQLAARQFIEFYGVSPESVIVDTCLTMNDQDPDLCPEDQSKLVRVRAYFRQPTVFLRLLNVQHFDMWVSATSQTAALDVVIVMDVSESMAAQTTYADWAAAEKLGASAGDPSTTANYGVIYRAPNINEIVPRLQPTGDLTQAVTDLFKIGTGTVNPVTPGLLLSPQIKVNNYLTYYPVGANVGYDGDIEGQIVALDTTVVKNSASRTAPIGPVLPTSRGDEDIERYNGNPAFQVDYVEGYFNDNTFPGKGYGNGPFLHPRPECRVRFYPRALNVGAARFRGMKLNDGSFKTYAQLLHDVGMTTEIAKDVLGNTIFNPDGTPARTVYFDGFLPTYNYFGCCNDPDDDSGFDDLVCQPFKQVREATFGFLERIDFLRGDRAAFVTYNRSAFLVNPYPYKDTAPGDETKRPGAMLGDRDHAYKTLKNLIGVNAEPYFYMMTDITAPNPETSPPVTEWTGQSDGYNKDGSQRKLNFADRTYNPAVYDPSVPQAVNYPVFDNCYVQNAMVTSSRTLFENGLANASLPAEDLPTPPLDDYGYNPNWKGQTNGGSEVIIEQVIEGGVPVRKYRQDDMSYEYWAACRSGNVGAALREANNALLNPLTSRRFGTIWIVVLMSDGGAGGSDPVRRNGRLLQEFNPYFPNKKDPVDPNKVTSYGQRGEYGAFGLCPIGNPTPNGKGELILYENDAPRYFVQNGSVVPNPGYPGAVLPNCADEDPMTRHTCDFRPLLTLPSHANSDEYSKAKINPMQDVFYRKPGEYDTSKGETADDAPPSDATDAEALAWNKQRNHLYDVDIAEVQEVFGVPTPNLQRGGCDVLYDVEDYARDWADYIAIANLGTVSGNTQVPTIFTIGFAIEFTTRRDLRTSATGPSAVTDHTKLVTDPVNVDMAQTNVKLLCELNVDRCLGEQLLRYIADVGDNNRIDNDYYQDLMYEWYDLENGGLKPGTNLMGTRYSVGTGYMDGYIDITTGFAFGSRDPCQVSDPAYFKAPTNKTYDFNGNKVLEDDELANEWGQLRANVSCGNYYYSPNADQLQFVFDDIASRMFTRLSR